MEAGEEQLIISLWQLQLKILMWGNIRVFHWCPNINLNSLIPFLEITTDI